MKKNALPLAEVLGFEASDKRIDILRRIGQVGSISEAARGAGVSYKAAWQALETLGNLAGLPLVEKVVGGSGGGGAALTAAGQRVLQAADALARARQQALASLDSKAGDGAATGAASSRAASALRTSMRNQFACTVGTLRPVQGQVRVQLLLAREGEAPLALHARITRESAQLLGLRPGLPVLALCKATAVRVTGQPARARADALDATNVWAGVVTRASRAAAGGEVSLRLSAKSGASGPHIVGFAAAGHGLRAGQTATIGLDESAVVIAATD
ncbi:ModE family transcriptional regulator [Hylemonella gracilis str. Niagara R]|uniref:ModE family transcriptional regulator n=1 Tax=Hylemonella gracilis str. Niagara R TaxID=1458275 RepID=A0A016XJA0_9BURK|nr:TOBE domain-containing protein [Hylemonella gracilis]EYC51926.1 ModE family transcriptional regulator [Hylemonella gracilis str. Niagara R]